MNKILGNRLLLVVISIPAICWGPGLYVPGELVSKFASSMIFIFGALSLMQRWRVIIDVLWHGKRDAESDSSHLGIVGDLLIMVGLIYWGAFAYWYVWAGQPQGWSATMYSSFGRILIGCGLFFNFWMVYKAGPRVKPAVARTWTPIGIVAGFLAGALFMSQWEDVDEAWLSVRPDRPPCAIDRPIWGTDRRTYHTPESRYRKSVIPSFCFETEDEAMSRGFRKAG